MREDRRPKAEEPDVPIGTLRPGADALVEFAAKRLAPHARVFHIGARGVTPTVLEGRTITRAEEDDAIAFLEAHASDPVEAVVAPWPAQYATLMPFLSAARGALRDGGEAIVCDLVWQTAPSPELMRAFAPAAGRERVRPIEGYEMQAEHCGFEIAARDAIDRARWIGALAPAQRAAVEADTRGAARLAIWALRRSPDAA